MLDSALADAVVVFHMLFIGFAVLGGLLVLRWKRVMALHLPAVAWATLVEVMHWPCPLTPLENHFRRRAGQVGYSEGFVEHYLEPILYPAGLTPQIQIMIGVGVLVVNVAVYSVVVLRWRRRSRKTGESAAPPDLSSLRPSSPVA